MLFCVLYRRDPSHPRPDNASPTGPFSPVMKLALIVAPVVALYSPTVVPLKLVPWFATKRLLPDNRSPTGPYSPVIKLGLIAAPVVALYTPTVLISPATFATKRSLSDNAT